jgi:cell division protein FtsI/penicillin-binding protein 2
VILDVRTGEILALANWPAYNPNARDRTARERMRNRALTDVFEPGSTLKPFTIAAALDAGAVRPDTLVATGGGSLAIGPEHDPRRASGRHAHGRAGDPEVVERRRGEDRARACPRRRCGSSSPTRASARRRRPASRAR